MLLMRSHAQGFGKVRKAIAFHLVSRLEDCGPGTVLFSDWPLEKRARQMLCPCAVGDFCKYMFFRPWRRVKPFRAITHARSWTRSYAQSSVPDISVTEILSASDFIAQKAGWREVLDRLPKGGRVFLPYGPPHVIPSTLQKELLVKHQHAITEWNRRAPSDLDVVVLYHSPENPASASVFNLLKSYFQPTQLPRGKPDSRTETYQYAHPAPLRFILVILPMPPPASALDHMVHNVLREPMVGRYEHFVHEQLRHNTPVPGAAALLQVYASHPDRVAVPIVHVYPASDWLLRQVEHKIGDSDPSSSPKKKKPLSGTSHLYKAAVLLGKRAGADAVTLLDRRRRKVFAHTDQGLRRVAKTGTMLSPKQAHRQRNRAERMRQTNEDKRSPDKAELSRTNAPMRGTEKTTRGG
ncbi:unnamed protein product [Mycena citricolor]|uniref:Uncharacterized protein n=1 Tax=Mycena citricolor TaxID=2018698 RepID=A0AAD2Q5X9_9AGAR|nr:unnamed protein product [Mycena citricolor]